MAGNFKGVFREGQWNGYSAAYGESFPMHKTIEKSTTHSQVEANSLIAKQMTDTRVALKEPLKGRWQC